MAKFTIKTKRGLVLVRKIVQAAFDDSQPPAGTIVTRWKASEKRDFEAALLWIANVEDAMIAREWEAKKAAADSAAIKKVEDAEREIASIEGGQQ